MFAAASETGDAPSMEPKKICELPSVCACPRGPAAVKLTVASWARVRAPTLSVAYPAVLPRLAVSVSAPPERFSVPEGRTKPWGTGHAILAARDVVDSPFVAINADDFYGRDAFAAVGGFLKAHEENGTRFCMGGYRLDVTLSEHGSVSRGVCQSDADGLLLTVREHTQIQRTAQGITDLAEGVGFSGAERVSMNCWGFTPDVFPLLEAGFKDFLIASAGDVERTRRG